MDKEIFQAFDFSFQECEEPIVIVDHRYHILYANELAQNLLQIEEDVNIGSWFNNESYKTWTRLATDIKSHSYIAEKMTIDTLYYKIKDMKVTSYYSDVYDWILLCFHYSEAPSKIKKHYDIEKKYQRIFDQPGYGLVLTDAEGKILEINEMAAKLLNISSKGLIGQYSKILLTLFPKNRSEILKFFHKLVETGSGEVTIQVPTKDGIRYVQLMCNYDHLADIHLIAIRDETEKTMLIKQIEHQQTLQMIGEMAASIAHEIKNPMTSLKGFTDLMKMTATDENKRYLSVIDSEIQRIESIVNEFLNLSKPGEYEMNVFSLGELVEQTIELMQPQALIQNIQIVYEKNIYEDDFILGNKNKMKQVLINLIKNAIEVMPAGGNITMQQYVDYYDTVTLSIKDDGTGMSEQQLQNIFLPFYTTKPEGTGLGLPFVVKTIEEHGGKIFATSKIGEGTTFELVFPLVMKNQNDRVAEDNITINVTDKQMQRNFYYPV
ncbi:PAS domain-containing sensor histidine kinase [Rummeliibacillus pycnus]|uniref:PAS domain-containing sensor histidine kinase n=1 Tax=Rummeliibacillus pycnus TaxID=101070 RepID=UPI000C99B421|nr:PAS domain-containing sensor histidine kinase [Rummeliibacillus pycnus]